MRKRLVVAGIMLVSAMVVFAAGQKESAKSDGGALVTSSGKPVITFMTTEFYGNELRNQASSQVVEKYEAYTNTQVKWQWEADGTYDEKMGITLMDKDNMPMIMTGKRTLSASIIDAAKKGAFWDLSKYIFDEKEYPNLSRANKNVLKALTVNGQVIGLYRARPIGRTGFAYRTDWAEKVGITKAPETYQDVYDMWYKFTYGDPDGDGKNNTYGLEMCKYTGPLDVIQTWFGVGNEWVELNGSLVPIHQTTEYQQALDWMRKVYADGLIRRDWATVDSSTFGDACKKGSAGSFLDVMDSSKRIWQYFIQNDIKSVTNPSQHASMTMVGPVNGKTLATSGFNGYYVITKAGAKTEQDLKNCLHFLDKMGDEEMMILADYGLEGITYDIDADGHIVLRNVPVKETPQLGLNQALCYIPYLKSQVTTLKGDIPTQEQDKAYAVNEQHAVFNPALGYLANSPINAEVGNDIEQIIDDARTQYICGQISKAQLDAASQQWLNRGGAQLIKEVNELYKADTSR
ncbi:MAG TPA: ABC transporter substrate-binding protein [Sphaerochaeta sp.]|nr:ABC transporter substrate-binding protein [Sphaerochaeta sp.]